MPRETRDVRQAPTSDADDRRWAAVVAKDAVFDDTFYVCVATTGIYCRPSCSARCPKRTNVTFCETCAQAEAAGFRACLRCKPGELSRTARQALLIADACRCIESAEVAPKLADLAAAARLSPYHFHRIFKAIVGLTPKDYAQAHRLTRVRDGLTRAKTVTAVMYDAGFNSSSRFYARATPALGMTPSAYRAGGPNSAITFAVGECTLGSILVAASEHGVCAILLGDDPDQLTRKLQDRFPHASFNGCKPAFNALMAKVIGFVDGLRSCLTLPLDVRGTAFQHRVWKVLQTIPPGETRSYAQVATLVGDPKAVRAVAGACAANIIAVAIPCHRVVRTDGTLSGYRWGVERKRDLLDREARLATKVEPRRKRAATST